jgi:hypothetical protein
MDGVNRLEIAHSFDTRCKKWRVAERLEHRFPRRSNRNFTGKVQNRFLWSSDGLSSKTTDFGTSVEYHLLAYQVD